jgi:hypothetical protein
VKRLWAVLVMAAGAAAVVLAPASGDADGPDPASSTEYRTVGSALLACPALSVTQDSASLLTGIVAPSPDDPTEAALGSGTAGGASEGSAGLRLIDAELDLARISRPGTPVTLLVAGRSQPSILMTAMGQFAPAAIAGVASVELAGAGAGLASAACPPPGPEWWFVGAGSQLGRGSALLVSNPAQEPARFDISLYARSGPVEALAGKGITLGPQSQVRLRLDALAQGEELLAIQVRATSGRIAAALRDVAVPRGEQPRGVDFLAPSIPPAKRLWIAGLPAGPGSRDLVLVNPGAQFATLQVQLITEDGTQEVTGLATVAVPAGSVVTTSLDRVLRGRGGTLALTSDVPVTGAVRSDWGSAQRDTAWLSATPMVASPNVLAGAALVPAGEGLTTTVAVAAPDGAVSGTLQVVTTGSGEESPFPAGGTLARGELGPAATDGPTVVAGAVEALPSIRVSVPAGSQVTVDLPDLGDAAVAHLTWLAATTSGPALLSHTTLDPEGPLATGYAWWPVASAVGITPVREDVGTLVPGD